MTEQNKLIVGFTTQDNLVVDCDDKDEWQVTKLAELIMQQWKQVGSCLIVQSSEQHYHLVFDNKLPWQKIQDIIFCLGDLDVVERNFAYFREIRHDLTLRISGKQYVTHLSPAPKPIKTIPALNYKIWYGILKYLECLNTFIVI